MAFQSNSLYHLYNRSIDKQVLFKDDADYRKFLEMVRKCLSDKCSILGWCLMPNHFHFLVYTNDNSTVKRKVGGLELQLLQNGIRNLLSSYAKYYNFRYKRKGNLFQQKTKSKIVESDGYRVLCYIHQNPWKAKLADSMEDWIYSSFCDFAGIRKGTLCDLQLAVELLDINSITFNKESYEVISIDTILKLGLDDCSPEG